MRRGQYDTAIFGGCLLLKTGQDGTIATRDAVLASSAGGGGYFQGPGPPIRGGRAAGPGLVAAFQSSPRH